MMPVVRQVCAWCGLVLVAGDEGAPVSHGLCAGCHKTVFPETWEPVRKEWVV